MEQCVRTYDTGVVGVEISDSVIESSDVAAFFMLKSTYRGKLEAARHKLVGSLVCSGSAERGDAVNHPDSPHYT